MVYSSLTFLFLFLPLVLSIYVLAPGFLRNPALVFASLTFYVWGGADFVLLFLLSITLNWLGALICDALIKRNRPVGVRCVTGICIILNLGLLGVYKYANFIVSQANILGQHLSRHFMPLGHAKIALPIGISFLTFHAVSYIVDVARGRICAQRNPLRFALYMTLFPHLIAGPIVRYADIESQLSDRPISWPGICNGMVRFVHGLMKKVLIADSVSLFADRAFGNAHHLSMGEAWIGLLAYSVQIYFDFSGYSDMAIGLGRMFGFNFPENFRRPYAATSLTDFWRRWHITLSSWFRDYVYIPLGGSRGSPFSTYRNLVIVFFLTGFWHGASWSFVVWGMWHGTILVVERLLGIRDKPSLIWVWPRRMITLLLVMFGWVLFRAENLLAAKDYFRAMFTWTRSFPFLMYEGLWVQPIVALGLGVMFFAATDEDSIGKRLDVSPGPSLAAYRLAACFLGLPAVLISLISGSASPFLYFRF
ncbi:MAG: alginate O-acetyltransferase complex protein AlgI [Chthoniobacter sp.]|jgi:alginate O-acetyltransferase complex protein AlgI|nr:alginate O-acetyltransferase complex protein AlgI [Chthoniobacter sp.]